MADVLLRTGETQPPIGLTSRQRRENMRGALAVARATEVTEREMLLVDDVHTPGITATARKAGMATVACKLKLASKYEDIRQGFKVSGLAGFGRPDSAQGAEGFRR